MSFSSKEMYADVESRGGILEPPGIVEAGCIQFIAGLSICIVTASEQLSSDPHSFNSS